MFTHKAIAELNALELMVYTYVSKHKNQVMYMTIRELAEAAGVSTTTVLRFCKKMGCDGYSEFRIRFKLYLEQTDAPPADSGIGEILSFFKSVSNEEFNQLIDQAVHHIAAAERIIFVGISTSGALGKYGARFFSNVGKFSTHIDDPYYPVNSDMYKNAVAIMLSVTGETEEILRLASQVQPAPLQYHQHHQQRNLFAGEAGGLQPLLPRSAAFDRRASQYHHADPRTLHY
uniref:RpiR n=1 Tax=Serratia marcescens TaxID=615 RepID=A0JKZ2_SERMA|nr:RpiR [Serratia marcescens]